MYPEVYVEHIGSSKVWPLRGPLRKCANALSGIFRETNGYYCGMD